MRKASAPRTVAPRLPKLAALALVFLGLSTNAHLDAATAWDMQAAFPQSHVIPQSKPSIYPVTDNSDQIHILSARDATLYRAAFAAQEKDDWKFADQVLEQVKDKTLVGHVLADRYLRREITLPEAQQWMASYADLPEAPVLYEQARHLQGSTAAHLTSPQTVASWSGVNGLSASSGFRSQNDNDAPLLKNHIGSKINAALHHGDPAKARDILNNELKRGTLSTSDAGEIISHIAATFFFEGEVDSARPLAHTAAAANVPLGLWVEGLSAWKQKDYNLAVHSFASLARAPNLSAWDRATASYWAYRASSRTGDKAQAQHWLAEAAKAPRSFYGTIAASLIGHRPDLSWKMPELTAKSVAVLAQRPAGWRALALVQIGKTELAEPELRHLNPMGSRSLQTAALALAEKAHMTSLTLQLGGVATNDNGQLYEAALYPLPPWQPASGFKVDRALMYALMRHESQFDPEAVSQRGACGLMQIMPSTARQISNDNQSGQDCPDQLFDPATNMELGQKYVRVLAGKPLIGDNLLLLLAAYNGGPGNLAHWIDGDDRADPLLFIESLPLRETRDYVQQVLLHYWMYRARLSEPETTIAELAHGEWPHYALRDESNIQHADAQNFEFASLDPAQLNGTR